MANKLYDETSIQATANAIRTRSGDNTQMYKVEDFADAINSIPRPSGIRSVTQNGTFDVEDKQFVAVNVEGGGSAPVLETLNVSANGTYTPAAGVDGYDEIIVNVPSDVPVLDTLNVTANGTYTPSTGTDGYDEVVVNVSPVLETKSITANGTYTPSTGKDGFSSVTVNVPEPTGSITITENGTFDVTDYASAIVNVSGGGGEIKTGSFILETNQDCSVTPYTITHNLGKAPKYFFLWYGTAPNTGVANGINQIDYINDGQTTYHTVTRVISSTARAYGFSSSDIEFNNNTVVIKNYIAMAKGSSNNAYHWVIA